MVIGLSLLAALLGAIMVIMSKRILTNDEYGSNEFLVITFGVTVLMLLPFIPFFWHLNPGPDTWKWFLAMFVIEFLYNWLAYKGMSKIKSSTFSLSGALSSLVTIGLVLTFSGIGSIGFPLLISLVVLLFGLGMVIRSRMDVIRDPTQRKLIFYPLAIILLGGTMAFVTKGLLSSGDISSFSYMFIMMAFLFVSMLLLLHPKRWRSCLRLSGKRITVRSILMFSRSWIIAQAILMGSIAIVKPLSESSPIFVALIALFLGMEKPSKLEIFGIALSTLAVMAVIHFS